MRSFAGLLLSSFLLSCSSSETTTSATDSGAADSVVGDGTSSDSTAACEKSACGSPPPSHCADGSSGTLTCGRDSKGTCTWSFTCPPGSDASDITDTTDAPACPTMRPTRLSACESLDQVCFYSCGVVMRCTSKGWDDDFTVDGGPPCP